MSGEANQVLWRGVQPVSGIRGVWPAIDAVRVQSSANAQGVATTLLYTVASGKKLFISSANQSSRVSADAACFSYFAIRNVADERVRTLLFEWFRFAGQTTNQVRYFPALEVPAGFDVYIDSNHDNLDVFGIFNGWLEDA